MASIRQEFRIGVAVERAWAALADFGAVHSRLAPGFVTACRLEDSRTRMVTFASGVVAREILVDCDPQARRLVYAIVGGRLTQHSASAQLFAEGEQCCRLVWIADFLPDALANYFGAQMELGAAAMRAALERDAANAASG
jgi:carbon monoxide dehydrogenase subunit G